ncbi:WXG100 family type VII secretion target [Blastococcus sp. Marseille-P5729]|uniref:WXG100 family type VII secretion target n=1 Tax=Blastococcus sp. Marseille-P5729 TaxID=2086582 RepID=UPI000D0F8714|nr:WXG100 family type VII secretion target [Blastococcus sp. Marseille-P5729]
MGTKTSTPEMQAFQVKASDAATTITTAMNKMIGELSVLDASKGAFARAFQVTRDIVNRETQNLSNALNGISVDVATAAAQYEQSDAEQEAEIKKAENAATGITAGLAR